ncbi:hypothetical protein EVAR_68460_1 [Eumeta japonica]|uniref:Uncharacterized protein n=1 Tax=Eumeta variegata TaxID=151549 RepID=A0A4C2A967_EUMVA|nr:hypothetical protein EVAR_68460_1 [Eumeta japonica]
MLRSFKFLTIVLHIYTLPAMKEPLDKRRLAHWAHKLGVLGPRARVLEHTDPESLGTQSFGLWVYRNPNNIRMKRKCNFTTTVTPEAQ